MLSAMRGEGSGAVMSADLPPTNLVLPDPVRGLFEAAKASLGHVKRIEALLARSFTAASQSWQSQLSESLDTVASFKTDRATRGLGLALLLQELVSAFESAIVGWFRNRPSRTETLAATSVDSLRLLCRTYADIYELLPMQHFEALEGLIREIENAEQRGGRADRSVRITRGRDPRESLEELGTRVEQLVLQGA